MNKKDIAPLDLCVPIYLNQQIVFDLLAILEDGFSTLRNVTSSATESATNKSTVGASIGASNVFALLGISLNAEGAREKGTQGQQQVSQEKVYTPSSLFAKLRLMLNQKELLTRIETDETFEKLAAGQFVEFRAVLRKNPLVDALEWFKQVSELASAFPNQATGTTQPGQHGKNKQPQSSNQLVMRQLDAMLAGLTYLNTLELIGDLLDVPKVTAVLSAKLDYFLDKDASEIIDAEFTVLGKIVRVVAKDSQDPINLLRKTSFGRFEAKIFDQLVHAFEGDAAATLGVKFSKLVTAIQSPAFQIIPIAIFT